MSALLKKLCPTFLGLVLLLALFFASSMHSPSAYAKPMIGNCPNLNAPLVVASKQSWSSAYIHLQGACFTPYGQVMLIVYVDGGGPKLTYVYADSGGSFDTWVGHYCAYSQEMTSGYDLTTGKLSNITTLNSLC